MDHTPYGIKQEPEVLTRCYYDTLSSSRLPDLENPDVWEGEVAACHSLPVVGSHDASLGNKALAVIAREVDDWSRPSPPPDAPSVRRTYGWNGTTRLLSWTWNATRVRDVSQRSTPERGYVRTRRGFQANACDSQ